MLYPACIFVCDRFGSQHMMPKLWSRHPRLEPTPEPSGGKIQWKLGLDFIDAEMKKRLKKGPTWTAASRGSSELTRWYLTPIAHSVTYQHGKPKFISQEVHVGVKLDILCVIKIIDSQCLKFSRCWKVASEQVQPGLQKAEVWVFHHLAKRTRI